MRTTFVSIALLLLGSTASLRAKEIELPGKQWTIRIDPTTMVFRARANDVGDIMISSIIYSVSFHVADLVHEGVHATWRLPDWDISVSARLDDDDVLAVDFTAGKETNFGWPVCQLQRATALILPMSEGLYVPLEDEEWAKHLVGKGECDTSADLSMPFWGVELHNGRTLTYVLTNPYNNHLNFGGGLLLGHTFPKNVPNKQFGVRIMLGDGSPVTPAKNYRQYLLKTGQFVGLKQKVEKTPEAAKLLGAAHIYLWGDGPLAWDDFRDMRKFAQRLSESADPIAKRIRALMSEETSNSLIKLASEPRVDNYRKGQIVGELNQLLKRRDLIAAPSELDDVAVARGNCQKLHAAFADVLIPPERWGDGTSVKMAEALAKAGIDRAWLGSPSWDGLKYHLDFTAKARSLGYLVGPYDSFHSIHRQGATDTWETAQFDDAELYESGAIVDAKGSKRTGFKGKGHLLSPAAARPHVERRVTKLMSAFRCNSWFIDCDAFGDVFDDYSPDHPMTQASDAAERVSRMAWIRDTFGAVIGSEGGSAYAAPAIHFAHGVMTPVIGWGDPDLKVKESKFYLGGYYPPDGPAVFFKQVPMKDEYRRIYADPRFRLPLYEVVFHDSVVATHQWGYGSLKFDDPGRTRELLELLYNVPPLYHLNLAEWAKRKSEITSHYAFFSPIHREAGLLPMTDFRWLSEDRMVQETTFGDGAMKLIANFGDTPYAGDRGNVLPHSIVAVRAGAMPSAPYPSPN